MTVTMERLWRSQVTRRVLIDKLLAWARGTDYPNRTLICYLDRPDSAVGRTADVNRPRLTVFKDIMIMDDSDHKYMLGFYEQKHPTQPRVPRYWWYSKSGGDWKVGLGHDDDPNKRKGRIKKGAKSEHEKMGYSFETVLPFHVDKRLRDVADRVAPKKTYKIPDYWNCLTLPLYYANHPSEQQRIIKDQDFGKLLSYSSHHVLKKRVPRGDGAFYESLGEFFSAKDGLAATYAGDRFCKKFGHQYKDCPAAETLLMTLEGGKVGTSYLMHPDYFSSVPQTAHSEQKKYKRSALMDQLLTKAKARSSETHTDSTFDLVNKPCTFYRIKITGIPSLPDLWLEYGIIHLNERYERPGKAPITTKPVWIRNVYVAPKNGVYLNTFGGAKEHVMQLSFLCQKPFDYDDQAGIVGGVETWDYTKGRISTKLYGGDYVSLTGFNERFSPLVRVFKAHHGLAHSYRVGRDEKPTAGGLFLELVGCVKDGIAGYAFSIGGERSTLYESCSDVYDCLSIFGKTIRKFSIILSSVFVRNALPGDAPNSLGGTVRTTETSMFGYFVRALFELAGKLTSAEWANLGLKKDQHPILWSVKKLRLDNSLIPIYKRGKTKRLTSSDYPAIFRILKADCMARLSRETIPEDEV